MMPLQAHTVKWSNFISQPDNNSYMIGPLCPPFPPPSQTVLPDNYQLSDTEKSNIRYLLIPDSNSGESPVTVLNEE